MKGYQEKYFPRSKTVCLISSEICFYFSNMMFLAFGKTFYLLIKMYTHLSALHSTDREHLSVWHGQANRNAFGHRTAVGIKSVLMRTLKLDHTAMLLLPNVTSPTHSCSFSSLFYPTLPLWWTHCSPGGDFTVCLLAAVGLACLCESV